MSTVQASDDIDAIIARTALKYDLLPYQSKPFGHSQPLRLGATAKLFGLEVAPLANARVLELGCASGGNLIPHAVRYPDATFIGIDLARTQVAAGRAQIAKLGLKNVEIRCQSFTEIGDELGVFDYIICHGVYSWVPPQVQDHIFRIIGARLSPVGLACISYNVLPGWRVLQPIRDAFMLEVADELDPHTRVAKARELAEFLKANTTDKGPYGAILQRWPDQFAKMPEDYIEHEFLEEMNHPTSVRAFAAGAASHGLGLLGDCDIATMIPDNYGKQVAEQVRARAGNNQVAMEQYLDLLTGRTFRNSILVSSKRMSQVRRSLLPEKLAGLHFLGQAGTKVTQEGETYVLTDNNGRKLSVRSPEVAAAFERIVAAFPSTTSVDDCVAHIKNAVEREQVLQGLLHLAVSGLAVLTSEAIEAGKVSKKPTAIPYARADAAASSNITTNLRHETISLDVAAQFLIPKLDGTHTHTQLANFLLEAVRTGRFNLLRDGKVPEKPEDLEKLAKDHLQNMLTGIANAALLEP